MNQNQKRGTKTKIKVPDRNPTRGLRHTSYLTFRV